MSSKTFSAKFSTFPMSAAKLLAEMLTGKVPFDRWKAIYASMELATYLMGYAVDVYATKSVKAARISQKKIGETLDKLVNQKSKPAASSFDIPVWLLPILIKLILKWVEGAYPSKGK